MAVDKLTQDVVSLQNDMTHVGTVVDMLDVSIEKLTELSTTISQLLAVQGNRLDMQEKLQEKLQELVDKRKNETDDAINKAYLRMERMEEKFQQDIKDNNNKVDDEIADLNTNITQLLTDMKKEISDQHKSTDERIKTVEKWMWTIAGVTGTFVTLFTILEQFTNIFG